MECRRGLAMRILSVCPSVCPSVIRVNCDKTVERSVQISIAYERSFSHIRHFSNADDSLFKAALKIAIMFFTHTFQMIGINTTISGNAHTKALILRAYLGDRDYIMRMLYKNCYYIA